MNTYTKVMMMITESVREVFFEVGFRAQEDRERREKNKKWKKCERDGGRRRGHIRNHFQSSGEVKVQFLRLQGVNFLPTTVHDALGMSIKEAQEKKRKQKRERDT
jgi:hypothetical protein